VSSVESKVNFWTFFSVRLEGLRLEKLEITIADEDYAGSDATWYADLYLDGIVVSCTTKDLEWVAAIINLLSLQLQRSLDLPLSSGVARNLAWGAVWHFYLKNSIYIKLLSIKHKNSIMSSA